MCPMLAMFNVAYSSEQPCGNLVQAVDSLAMPFNLVSTFLRSELNQAVNRKLPGPSGRQHSPSGCMQISTDQNVHLIWFTTAP